MEVSDRRVRLGANGDGLAPAFRAAALDDLFAEFDAEMVFRLPGHRAKAQRGFTLKAQPENQRQSFCKRQFEKRPVLRQVTHHASYMFILVGIENHRVHKRRAPRRAAFLVTLRIAFHGLAKPKRFHSQSLGQIPKTIIINFTKIVGMEKVSAQAIDSRPQFGLKRIGCRSKDLP